MLNALVLHCCFMNHKILLLLIITCLLALMCGDFTLYIMTTSQYYSEKLPPLIHHQNAHT